MKLISLKIGQITITTNMLISLVGALFILGIGIGVTVASPNNSKFALFICAIISIAIVAITFLKNKQN